MQVIAYPNSYDDASPPPTKSPRKIVSRKLASATAFGTDLGSQATPPREKKKKAAAALSEEDEFILVHFRLFLTVLAS